MSFESSSRESVERDLEEARQRLVLHRYDQDERHTEAVLSTPTTLEHHREHGLPPTQLRNGSYGSVSTLQSIQQKAPPKVKRYRIPFLILIAFDFGMVIFLSIICSEWHKDKQTIPYFSFDIRKGFFDLVMLATARVVFNVLFYLLLGWITRIVMGIVTVVSACFVPIKAYYTWDNISNAEILEAIAVLLMLFVSFVLPWFTAFFFEFKYLPAEISRLDITTWWDYRPWLWPRALLKQPRDNIPPIPEVVENPVPQDAIHRPRRTGSTLSLDFRTPIGSSRGSPIRGFERNGNDDLPAIVEEEALSSDLPSEDMRFKQEGKAALESLKSLVQNDDHWIFDKSSDGITIYKLSGPRQKIWRGDVVIKTSAGHLWNILYPGDQTHEWNPQCALNETIYRIDENTDIAYSVTNPIGPISSRDFVSVRQIAAENGCYYSASQSTTTTLKPEQPGKVRAENGPCGYVVIPVDSGYTKLIWIINSNLKGWIPQTAIDQGLSGALIAGLQELQTYVLNH